MATREMSYGSAWSINREELTNWLHNMYSDFRSCTNDHTAPAVKRWWLKYCISDDTYFIRGSGVRLTMHHLIDFALQKDMTEHTGKIRKILSMKDFIALNKGAIVEFEADERFFYKGTLHQDVGIYSATVLKQPHGTLRLVFFKRLPIAPKPY